MISARKPPVSRVSGLGYVGGPITDAPVWHELLRTVYSLERCSDSRGGLRQYRLDEHHHWLALQEGDVDKVAFVGWEVETREDFREISARLSENDVAVEPGGRAMRRTRGNGVNCARRSRWGACRSIFWPETGCHAVCIGTRNGRL